MEQEKVNTNQIDEGVSKNMEIIKKCGELIDALDALSEQEEE